MGRIESRADFVAFLHALHEELTHRPEAWENRELPSFLEALAAWVEDMEGYFQDRGEATPALPDWNLLAEMLLAARVYE